MLVIQGSMIFYFTRGQKLSRQQLEDFLISKPQFTIGSMILWYAALFFFLYITLSVLRGVPFWKSLGWRSLLPRSDGKRRLPLTFLFAGMGLSLFVAVVSSRLKTPERMPIEEMFKHRETALLFVAMAIIVAPLVEETLFRGYLYPLLARSFGVTPAILVTGLLFGAMHGEQLGWSLGLVAVLVTVGILFTLVRARTGSVYASYLMHLGYNGFISVVTLIATHGFTQAPGKP